MSSLSHYLQGFIHPRWLAGFLPSTVSPRFAPKKGHRLLPPFRLSGHHGTHLRFRFHAIRSATFVARPPWWVAQGAPGTWGAPCWHGSNLISRPWNRLSCPKAARSFSPSKSMCLEGCIEVNKAERKDGDGRWAGGRIWNLDGDEWCDSSYCCVVFPRAIFLCWNDGSLLSISIKLIIEDTLESLEILLQGC